MILKWIITKATPENRWIYVGLKIAYFCFKVHSSENYPSKSTVYFWVHWQNLKRAVAVPWKSIYCGRHWNTLNCGTVLMVTKGRKWQIRCLSFTEKRFEAECSTTWDHLPSSMHRISGTRDKQKIILLLDTGYSPSELCLHEKLCRY